MDIINKDTSWFLSDEGTRAYNSLNSLADKTIFIYSCLKNIAYTNIGSFYIDEKEKALLKISLLLADAISQSNAEYSQYPALVDPSKNPYVAYLANTASEEVYSDNRLFIIFTSILRGLVNPYDPESWLYTVDLEITPKEVKSSYGNRYITIDPYTYDNGDDHYVNGKKLYHLDNLYPGYEYCEGHYYDDDGLILDDDPDFKMFLDLYEKTTHVTYLVDYLSQKENVHVYSENLEMAEYPPLSAEDGYIQLAFVWAFLN